MLVGKEKISAVWDAGEIRNGIRDCRKIEILKSFE